MAKRLFVSLLLLVLIGVVAVIAFGVVAPVNVQSTNVQRMLTTNVLWGKNPFTATVGINLAAFTACQQEKAALDIVILIDASGSMQGDPLNSALAGARAFSDSLDFTRHRVSVGIFSDTVFAQIGLTDQKNEIAPLLSSVSSTGGGTSLAAPMGFARTELESRRRQIDSIPIVLLFSDGNAGDASLAAEISREIQGFGGQVFVVGLRNNDFQQEPLEQIASSPDSLRIAPTPAELVELFGEIGEIVNSFVLQDVRYLEPVAFDDMDVALPLDTQPLAITPNGISLHIDALTSQDAAAMGGFYYQVTPKRYGLLKITKQPATLSLEACNAQAISETLPAGPSLLVLPPLPLMIPIPLLLLLLAALPLLFSRKPVEQEDRKNNMRTPLPPPPPLDQTAFTTWLYNAKDLSGEGGLSGDRLAPTPTLLIGLGDAGRVVLHQLADRVHERTGEQWPNNLRLLHLAIQSDESRSTPSPELPHNVEQVVFKRDIDRQSLDGLHMTWARENTHAPRIRGRLALFTDLSHGKGESLLWGPLGRAINNQKNVTVWIISDAFGPASGMIADIAHLIRVRSGSGIINSVRLCLAMQNADWGMTTSQSGLDERSFATLRELQRLQSNEETPFIYTAMQGQPELRATHTGKLFDEMYLFDGQGEETNNDPYDISALPAEKGVLRVISNAMMALLEGPISTEFYLHEKNAQSGPSRSGAVDLESYGSVMGCSVIRAPVEATRRLAELRLLHKALFDPAHGIFGWGVLDDEGNQRGADISTVSVTDDDRNAFDREVGVTRSQSTDQFQELLTAFLVRRMNDGRPLRLRWAEQLVASLAGQSYPSAPIQAVRNEIQKWSRLIAVAGRSSSASPSGASSGSLASFSFNTPQRPTATATTTTTSASLVARWEEEWKNTRSGFPATGNDEPEQIAWSLSDEKEMFKRYFGKDTTTIKRIQERTFWYWTLSPTPSLRLLILPTDLSALHAEGGTVAENILHKPHAYTVGPEDVAGLFRQMRAAVRPFSQILREESRDSGALASMLQKVEIQQRLDRNASPLYAAVKRGKEAVGAPYLRYLLVPRGLTIDSKRVKATHPLTGSDPTTCVLLHAQHTVRLGNMRSYVEAQSAYQPSADLFVFPAEQEAARRERPARRLAQRGQLPILSTKTTALLDRDAQLIDQIGKLFVRGQLELTESGDSWSVRAQQTELQPLAGTAGDLLRDALRRVRTDPGLRDTIQRLALERSGAGSKIAQIESQLEKLLSASQQPAERDLAVIIAWALEDSQ